MLRAIQRNFTFIRNAADKLCSVRTLCTETIPLEADIKDFNLVKIVGKIVSPLRSLPDGSQSCIVRTAEGHKSWTHQINIPQNDKNEEYSTNDRVSIIGTLHTKPINVNDGKIRQRVIVKAKSMRVRNHERGTDDTSTDVNNVKLLGRVTGKVFVGDGHTLLNLVSMFQRRGNGTTPGTIRADFHQVVAFEPSVRDFMRNLQRYDRVYMEGKLAYRKYLLGDNKPQLMGYIIPAIMRKEDSLQAKEGN